MFGFRRKKAMKDFYENHKAFLNWYLEKQCDVSERLYHLVIGHLVECLDWNLEKVKHLNDFEQKKWIMIQINRFLEDEK